MRASRATVRMPLRMPAGNRSSPPKPRPAQKNIGLWADPAYAILSADDRAAFAAPRTGMVLVEGTPASLGETAARFYLNFGRSRADFAMTLPKRGANALEKAGIKVQDLVGKRLRVRGLLDATFGPQMELTDPDQLELID